MSENTKQKRKLFLHALQERLIPFLRGKGFEQLSLRKEERKSREMNAAFPFGYMRRIKGTDYELIEIQLDKRGAAKFVLNVGVVPPEGTDLPWGHFDQDRTSISGLPESYRLYSSRRFMKWFSPSWLAWPSDIESRTRKAVDRAIVLYPEVEDWFATRTIGPHMRRLGYPITGPVKNGS